MVSNTSLAWCGALCNEASSLGPADLQDICSLSRPQCGWYIPRYCVMVSMNFAETSDDRQRRLAVDVPHVQDQHNDAVLPQLR